MDGLGDEIEERLKGNLARVRQLVSDAAVLSGRSAAEVTLVAVTKSVESHFIPALLANGVTAIGESRPEVVQRKQRELGDVDVPWHLIGHFQRKKVARSLPLLDLLHSLHGVTLLGQIDVRMAQQDVRTAPLPVLLQVNTSGEDSKQGFSPRDALDAADLADAALGVDFRGLMTMAPPGDPDTARRSFEGLRELAEKIGRDRARELSMGMSDDFEIAIEEGATLVRVGSSLFDGIVVNS